MGEREAETAVFLVKGGSNTGLSLEVVDGASEVQSSNLTAKWSTHNISLSLSSALQALASIFMGKPKQNECPWFFKYGYI